MTGPETSEKVGSVHGSGHKIGPLQLLHRWKYQNVARPAAPAMSPAATIAAIQRRLFRPVLAATAGTGAKLRSWEVMVA